MGSINAYGTTWQDEALGGYPASRDPQSKRRTPRTRCTQRRRMKPDRNDEGCPKQPSRPADESGAGPERFLQGHQVRDGPGSANSRRTSQSPNRTCNQGEIMATNIDRTSPVGSALSANAGRLDRSRAADLATLEHLARRRRQLDRERERARRELEDHVHRVSLDSEEAAALLGVSVRLVRELARLGPTRFARRDGQDVVLGLPSFRYRGGYRFLHHDIEPLLGRQPGDR